MTTLSSRQKALATLLLQEGLPLVSACAAVGNASQESACQPVCPSHDESDGLWQWRLYRLAWLKNWAQQTYGTAISWQDMAVQVKFFILEMKTNYVSLWDDLMEGKKSLKNLTANIMEFYERPNPLYANLDNRIAQANNTYFAMGGGTPPIVTPPPAPTQSDLQLAINDLKAKQAAATAAATAAAAAKEAVQHQIAVLQDQLKQAQEAIQ